MATFTNLPSGSGHYYTVEYMPTDSTALFGTLYWGSKNGIRIASGQTTHETFVRNAPYAPAMCVFDNLTNANVTSQVVLVGTPLRIDLTVNNPSYLGADSQSVRGRVVLDTNKTLPFEVEMSSTLLAMPVGSTSTISFGFTPHAPRSYYRAGALIATINGTDTYTEGFTTYDQPFFTVVDLTSSVQEKALPKDFVLPQNYPNPFNPSTVIHCEVPRESYISLRVYNPLGQEIRTLIDATMSAGVYEAVRCGRIAKWDVHLSDESRGVRHVAKAPSAAKRRDSGSVCPPGRHDPSTYRGFRGIEMPDPADTPAAP